MSFLTPLAFIAGLLAIPIILLYMLRLRRREVLVSSNFLWAQVVRDTEANTPWQKLRRNILLFLQLLILAALVFALARPFITVPTVSRGQIELLLDASASMNAGDQPGGVSRFETARQQALGIVDTMGAGDLMTVIRVSDVPEVLLGATADPVLLREAINGAQAGTAEADWTAALTLAAADATGAADVSMVIISDGGLGEASGLPGVPGNLRYVPVGQASDNLAISALSTRARPGQQTELFAQVTNYGTEDAEVIFDLRVDGELFVAERYTVPAGQNLPIVSSQLPVNFTALQAGLTLPAASTARDYLAEDNTAWAVSSGASDRRALVMSVQPNRFLDQVLRSLPGVQYTQGDVTQGLPNQDYDLYILDGWLPATLPTGDLLVINPPGSSPLFTLTGESEDTASPAVLQNDPRMTFVDFADVSVLRFKTFAGVEWADPLIVAAGGPLLLAGEVDGRQVALLTFALTESDLPLQITWPILIANLLNWYAPPAVISAPDGIQVGGSLSLRPPLDSTEIRITRPDGSIRTLAVDRQTLAFADTDLAGIYTVEVLRGDEVSQRAGFAVNLFSPVESTITPQESISLSGAEITPALRDEVGQREFWPWAALAAILILLIEWYVYQRRVQARTVFQPVLRRRSVG